MEIGEDRIDHAHAEGCLPFQRLQGERAVDQLRLFSKVVRDGHFLGATINHAQPRRRPMPRVDLRLAMVPLGTVAVFGTGNLPLAFSVAGGDTASALAAPVIVKLRSVHLDFRSGRPCHTGRRQGTRNARGRFLAPVWRWSQAWRSACVASCHQGGRAHRVAQASLPRADSKRTLRSDHRICQDE